MSDPDQPIKDLYFVGWKINAIYNTHINSPYNFSIQNCLQNSDRVQLRFQSPKRCIIKHLKHTKLYSIEFLRTEMTSDPSNYHREYSSSGSFPPIFQFEGSDVISVLKNSIDYSFAFFKCLLLPTISFKFVFLVPHCLEIYIMNTKESVRQITLCNPDLK